MTISRAESVSSLRGERRPPSTFVAGFQMLTGLSTQSRIAEDSSLYSGLIPEFILRYRTSDEFEQQRQAKLAASHLISRLRQSRAIAIMNHI